MAWDFLGIPGTSWETLRLRLPGNPWGFLGLWESLGLPRNPWDFLGIPGNPRDFVGIPGISLESFGLQKFLAQGSLILKEYSDFVWGFSPYF